MDNTEKCEEGFRLLSIATDWFEKGCAAIERGDMAGFRVARLAHDMVAAAHRALMEGERDA